MDKATREIVQDLIEIAENQARILSGDIKASMKISPKLDFATDLSVAYLTRINRVVNAARLKITQKETP